MHEIVFHPCFFISYFLIPPIKCFYYILFLVIYKTGKFVYCVIGYVIVNFLKLLIVVSNN